MWRRRFGLSTRSMNGSAGRPSLRSGATPRLLLAEIACAPALRHAPGMPVLERVKGIEPSS